MNTDFQIKQLQKLLDTYADMQRISQYNDLSDLPKVDRQSLVSSSIAAIHRLSGDNSTYSKEIEKVQSVNRYLHKHTSDIMGIVNALKYDIENGYLQSLIEIVHADIFSDFLDMANHLNESGYKDAAAVIAGSTLENHIKQLCDKHGIDKNDDKGKPKKASSLNVELTKSNVYEKLDNKNITAWLDLRNKAAHGNYDEYSTDQVKLLISSIQDFITRIKA